MKILAIEARTPDGDTDTLEVRADHISAILGDHIYLIGGQVIKARDWTDDAFDHWVSYVAGVQS